MNMTNEQYYWYVRRRSLLNAYAAQASNLHTAAAAGSSDSATPTPTPTPTPDPEPVTPTKQEAATYSEVANALADSSVPEVELAADITIPEGEVGIRIETGTTKTINLNGKTIEATSLKSANDGGNQDTVIAVKRGAKLILDGDGTVDCTKSSSAIMSPIKLTVKDEGKEGTDAEVVINGGTYLGNSYAICGNGNRQGGIVTINGGKFEATEVGEGEGSNAIYQPMRCTTTINDGEFVGTTAVVVKCGTMTINGGTFHGTGKQVDFVHNGGGWDSTGDTFAVEACDYPGGIPTVKITGGTFISDNAAPIASYAQAGYERPTKFVYGGTFSKQIDAELIADGYEQVEKDGMWVVQKA